MISHFRLLRQSWLLLGRRLSGHGLMAQLKVMDGAVGILICIAGREDAPHLGPGLDQSE